MSLTFLHKLKPALAFTALLLLGGCVQGANDIDQLKTEHLAYTLPKASGNLPPVSGRIGSFLSANYAENKADFDTAARILYHLWQEDNRSKDITYKAFSNNLLGGFHIRAGEVADDIRKRGLSSSRRNEQNTLSLFLAARYLKNQQYALAEAELDNNITRIGLAQYVVPIMQAWIKVGLNQPDQAITLLDAAYEKTPVKSILQLNKAYIYSHLQEYDKAADATQILLDQINTKPNHLRGLYAKLLYLSKGSVASNSYVRGMPNSKTKTQLTQILRPGGGFHADQLGLTSPELGFAEGINELIKILRDESPRIGVLYAQLGLMISPSNAQTIIILADALFDLERYSKSVQQLMKIADQKNPFYRDAIILRAEAEQLGGKTEAAIETMQKAISLFPEDHDLYFELGQVYQNEERYAESAKAFTQAIEGRPETQPQWSDYYFRGIAFERTDRWALAEKDFLKALDIDPNNPFVLNYLGYSWIDKRQNIDEALRMLKIAVEREPNNAYIIDSYGWALYRLERFEEAKDYLEQAVLQEPSESVIQDHLGDVYWHLERKLEAKYQWQHALTLDPEKPEEHQKIQEKIDGKRFPTP